MMRAFVRSVRGIKDSVVLNEVVRLLETGNVEGTIRLLGLERGAFGAVEDQIMEAYRTGGLTAAEQIGRFPTQEGSVVLRFDVRSPRAERWVQDHSSGLIREIVDDQRAMVRSRLTQSLAEGRNPRSAALDLVGRIDPRTRSRTGGFIGLTEKQSDWISNARRELEELNPNYLRRDLRDRRLDGRIRRAIESGEPLSQQDIDRSITRLQARTERFRGEAIARTESVTSLRAGQHEAVQQAIDEGEVDEAETLKTWDATGGTRTRDAHMEMDGQTVPVDQPFEAPDGSLLMFPGDNSMGASAEMVINCRCRERIEIDFLGRLKRIEGF